MSNGVQVDPYKSYVCWPHGRHRVGNGPAFDLLALGRPLNLQNLRVAEKKDGKRRWRERGERRGGVLDAAAALVARERVDW